jgi:hypothetical protein
MRLILFFIQIIIIIGFSVISCSTGGGGTEWEARISGRVLDTTGTPCVAAKVLLLSANFNPLKDSISDNSRYVLTDNTGSYSIIINEPGYFNIEISNTVTRDKALITGISVNDVDKTKLPDAIINKCGTIIINISDDSSANNAYVYIPGTTSYVHVSDGKAILTGVPSGSVPALYYLRNNQDARLLKSGIDVPSDGTVFIKESSCWNFSKKIFINTTASGAGIENNVYNFPLLLRLSKNNFDFSRTESTGNDVYFTKTDGTRIAFEIERWDRQAQLAEIWVKIDTVFGNNPNQCLIMFWGNSNAITSSSPSKVFDTSDGFAGVWHLGQPNGSTISDATGNGINGNAVSTTAANGIIGLAQSFDGSTSHIRIKEIAESKLNVSENDSFSVSAWVKTNVLDSSYQGILYKSNLQYGLQIRPENNWEFFTFTDKNGWENTNYPANATTWHLLTGVRSGSRQFLYIDGICVDSSISVVSSKLTRDTLTDLEIGHCLNGGLEPDRYFDGTIDEVRILRTATNPDWIKLCFMNQREKDGVLNW